MKRTFLILCSILLLLMVYGGGIPEYQNTYFYLGYFSLPLLLAFSINFILNLLIINKAKEN